MFARLVTPEGLPVGEEVFLGAHSAGNPLVTALEALDRHHVGVRSTVVADAGRINEANEAALHQRGTPSILSARLKFRPVAQQRKIRNPDGSSAWDRDESSESIGPLPAPKSRRAHTHCHLVAAPTRMPTTGSSGSRSCARVGQKPAPRLAQQPRHGTGLAFPDEQVRLNEDKTAPAARWDGLRGGGAWG